MGLPIEGGYFPGVRRRQLGLVVMAILGGMACAATFVVVEALRALHDPIKATASSAAVPTPKPSAFGSAVITPKLPDVKLTPAQIVQGGSPSIVTVTGYDADEKPIAQGAGYVYMASGIVVTNFSAIRGASSVTVDTASGEELSVIALMGYSPARDLAAIAVLEGNLPALETDGDAMVTEGDSIVALGPEKAMSQGAVGPRRAIGGVDLIQITAATSAGAPVMNEHGKVIGLATRRMVGGQATTFAIPSHYISDLLAEQHVISFAQMLEETGSK